MRTKSVGKKIKNTLEDVRLTQMELAKKLHINQSLISQWVSGYRNPSLSSLKKIAKATGKPLQYFFDNSINNVLGDNNITTKNQNIVNNSTEIDLLKKEITLLKKENELLKLQSELLGQNKKKVASAKRINVGR